MKKIAIIITALFPIISLAGEIQISSASLTCSDNIKNRYRYEASLTLKNISNNKINLITKKTGVLVVREYNGNPAEISITPKESSVNNKLKIPTSEK